MRLEDIDEPVSVRADFRGGEITPRAFRRGRKAYTVTAVNARWVDREGAHPLWRFSVQAGGDTYFLALRTSQMIWRLERVMVEG